MEQRINFVQQHKGVITSTYSSSRSVPLFLKHPALNKEIVAKDNVNKDTVKDEEESGDWDVASKSVQQEVKNTPIQVK